MLNALMESVADILRRRK